MTLEQKIGQLCVFGFDGPVPPTSLYGFLQEWGLGGVILLGSNLKSPAQILELTRALRELAASPSPSLFIGVDQEGGRVSRLKPPFTQFPPAARLGTHGSEELARRVGGVIGEELRAVGINVDFAPVLDVHTNPDNPVIGDRAFAADPDVVARMGIAFSRGLQAEGVSATGKHFPGHGDTSTDSHLDLPIVHHPKDRLARVELYPFRRAIEAGLSMLMTAHVLCPALDPALPATLSPLVLTQLLRNEMGFEGIIVSDDLSMEAIAGRWSAEEAACRFIEAGGDLIMMVNNVERQQAMLHGLLHAVRSNRLPEARLETSLGRILNVKKGLSSFGRQVEGEEALGLIGRPEHLEFARSLQRHVAG
ncbi:MAG: beta-N-acetylhexosaminidase [Candidatus Methylomirabilales bacterium]